MDKVDKLMQDLASTGSTSLELGFAQWTERVKMKMVWSPRDLIMWKHMMDAYASGNTVDAFVQWAIENLDAVRLDHPKEMP